MMLSRDTLPGSPARLPVRLNVGVFCLGREWGDESPAAESWSLSSRVPRVQEPPGLHEARGSVSAPV